MGKHSHPNRHDVYVAIGNEEYQRQLARTALPRGYDPSSPNNTVQVREAAQPGINGEPAYWDF